MSNGFGIRLDSDRGVAQEETLDLALLVRDPEIVAELSAHPAGRVRDEFALAALRIGILALRGARGRLDTDTIRNEGDRLLLQLQNRLNLHQQTVADQLAGTLEKYFDPKDGHFNERVERLVRKDGELEELLRRQIGADDSQLGRTLASHVGAQSPLMKRLSPDESESILNTLGETLNEALASHRVKILGEFTLDNEDSALSRLVRKVSQHHGESIDKVVGELTLDNEDSALSRLLREFSLDEEASSLARMRRELLDVLTEHKKESVEFRAEVLKTLSAIKARKEEAQRSTRHGDEFEDEVHAFLERECRGSGDVVTRTGQTTGRIKNCKVGDGTVDLGSDRAAAGSRIVVEAKEQERYTRARALAEIETARKNRAAEIGLFVFSRRTAPEELQPFERYGNDVIVAWDPEDRVTDVYLSAGLSVAKALCTRAAVLHKADRADFEEIDRAIRAIEKQGNGFDEITRLSGTIHSHSRKILDRADRMRHDLAVQIETLDRHIAQLKRAIDSTV